MPDTFVTAREVTSRGITSRDFAARDFSTHDFATHEVRMQAVASAAPVYRFAAVARSGTARTPAPMFSFWLQLRGTAQVTAAEGSFQLHPGEWVAFERGSTPEIQASRHGLAIGVVLPPELLGSGMGATDRGLLPGRGTLAIADRRIVLRLWRQGASLGTDTGLATLSGVLKPLLRELQQAQEAFAPMIERCPGRSFHRKTRIFARVQKARLFLEGNPQRMLRIEDLMELTRFSSWWLSKTFHAVYQETLQRASMRLRMQRARDLLQNSQLSIGELAEACGFHDPCSFARQFKAWHGLTASAWRAGQQVAAAG